MVHREEHRALRRGRGVGVRLGKREQVVSYYRGRRRANPAAEERREREAREEAKYEKERARFHRLMKNFKAIPLKGAAAQHAWESKELRSFYVRKDDREIIRTDGRSLFLQNQGYPSWNFYRLVPKYHAVRPDDETAIRDRSRRRTRRDDPDMMLGAGWGPVETSQQREARKERERAERHRRYYQSTQFQGEQGPGYDQKRPRRRAKKKKRSK